MEPEGTGWAGLGRGRAGAKGRPWRERDRQAPPPGKGEARELTERQGIAHQRALPPHSHPSTPS